MPIAGAAYGASQSLEKIMAEQMLQAQMVQREQQAQQQMAMQQQQIAAAMKQTQFQNDRLTAADEERASDKLQAKEVAGLRKRGQSNMAGVIGMGLDPQTAKREMAFTALNNDVDIPNGVMQALEPPKVERDPIADHEAKARIDAQYRQKPTGGGGPKTPQFVTMPDGSTVDINGIAPKGSRPYEKPGKPEDEGRSPYTVERAARTVQSVDELMGQVSKWSTGYGSLLSGVPESDARSFAAQLDTLKANIAFNELTAMREASKTGGALGQVSDREGRLLAAALGALDQGQSAEQIKAQLRKIKDSVERWQAAGGQSGEPMRPVTSDRNTPGTKPSAADLIKRYGGKD